MSRGWSPESRALWNEQHDPSGHEFEHAIAEPLAAYCVRNGMDCYILSGSEEDLHQGTDVLIYDRLGLVTFGVGILRLDITHNFPGKDNMPLLWDPTPGLDMHGNQVMMGIRTGNTTAGFEAPVVVIGTDMPREDVNAQTSFMRRETAKNAGRYIAEAAEAMSAYIALSDARYAAHLENKVLSDPDGDWFLPETDRLLPNVYGTDKLHTFRPSGTTLQGIRTARTIALEHAVDPRLPGGMRHILHEFIDSTREKMPPQAKQRRPRDAAGILKSIEEYRYRAKANGPQDSLGGASK